MQCTNALHLFIIIHEKGRYVSKKYLNIGVLRDMRIIVKTGIIAVMLLACIGAASAASFQNGGFERPLVISPLTWNIFADNTPLLVWDVQWANDGSLLLLKHMIQH